MKNRLFIALAATIGLLSLSSCASIISKSAYPVNIDTTPDGAQVIINNHKGEQVYQGITPTNVKLKASGGFMKKAVYEIKFSKEGFQDQTYPLSATIDGWYFGNLLIGGLIGILIVDPLTGAMFKIDNPSVQVSMERQTIGDNTRALRIYDINEIPASMKSKLVRLNETRSN